MYGLTGTWHLVKLGLRLDRIKLPVAILAVCLLLFLTVTSVVDLYAGDTAGMINYAATSAPSVVARVFAGPIHGPELGSIVLNEGFLFTAIAVAFISTLTVIRHTRQNEEANRTELVGSMSISKHAPLAAALIVAVIANVFLSIVAALTLLVGEIGRASCRERVCVGV